MSAFFEITLLILLVIFAVGSAAAKNILASLIIYMPYSIVMACTLFTLRAPDLAITKASVDVGITLILFFLTLNKVHAIPCTLKKSASSRKTRPEGCITSRTGSGGTSRAKRFFTEKSGSKKK
jgi:uncharacterized MnhB-related membrane protein